MELQWISVQLVVCGLNILVLPIGLVEEFLHFAIIDGTKPIQKPFLSNVLSSGLDYHTGVNFCNP